MNDNDALRTLTQNNPYVRYVFDYILEARQINRHEVRFDLFKKQVEDYIGQKLDRSLLLGAFRLLEEQGAGRLIKGSRGYPTRFRWDEAGMIQIAQIALGLEEETAFESEDNTEKTYLHCFQLRHDYEFEIELPADLTEDESVRIADLISGLTVTHKHPNDQPVRIYRFPLRDGLDFELELPVDLTQSESWRLREYIGALPINSDPDLDELDNEDFDIFDELFEEISDEELERI